VSGRGSSELRGLPRLVIIDRADIIDPDDCQTALGNETLSLVAAPIAYRHLGVELTAIRGDSGRTETQEQ
jgi:hypothetical protein